MTIGKLAEAAGIGVETVRYYQRIGLIEEPSKPDSGYRQYPEGALERIRFIRKAKDLGFSLKDVKELLTLRHEPDVCEEVCHTAERIRTEIRDRIRDLERLELTLSELLARSGKNSECPVLKALEP